MISFSTVNRRPLAPASRDIVLKSMLHLHEQRRYEMYAACVMPDHAHFLIEPQIKEDDQEGKPVFWPLTEILHSLKSFTAHEINKSEGTTGPVWEKESFDRLIRSGSDLEEKFHYICGNPWSANVVGPNESYPWIWTPAPRRDAEESTRDARAPQSLMSGDFAFKLYDTYGFPLDLTQLMARERGLSVDTDGFDKLMDEQKKRSQAAQKKQVIELSQIDTTTPTTFVGYDNLETPAKVLEVVRIKDKTAVILDTSSCYAEMGGQVGDTGKLSLGGSSWRIVNTQKVDNTWLHFLETENLQLDALPSPGSNVTLGVDLPRRAAIQRHHTVTHLLHWALHEVVSQDAAQKGSYVGPDKLTFDFNSVPLTLEQVLEIERLVNERIVENAPVAALELPYLEIKNRPEVMQFFGEKYGDTVRVIQIGGKPGSLNGYSMELCGGTHARATGEIGLFRIVSEGAIAAGVRRIEAVAGLCAYQKTRQETALIGVLAGKINSPAGELEHKLDNLLSQQKELEKRLKAMQQKQAADTARSLAAQACTIGSVRAIVQNLGEVDSEYLQHVTEALKGDFKGVVVLACVGGGTVGLAAWVAPELTQQFQAGKIIQAIAPIVGGKGGGKPDFARGGGKDASRVEEALAKAKSLLGGIGN
jgi:alanyl-tRNA synthetase